MPTVEARSDEAMAGLAAHAVAVATARSVEDLRLMRIREPSLRQAQRMVWYLAHTAFGWSQRRVGLAFGVDHRAVARACAQIEADRDDPLVDAILGSLEAGLRVLTPKGAGA